MKSIKALAFLMMITVSLMSCMKEYSLENGGSTGMATGTLKVGGSGECLPSSVHGIYIAGTTTTASNYINVDVDITALGAYTITTNLVNGYNFSATGVATSMGVQTIKLIASGTPTASGANTFTVAFGTSQCNIVVDVFPAGTGNATFTLGGNPGACTPATLAGTYTQGVTMTSSNTVTIQLNVTVAGIYNISTSAVNGVTFSGTGMLAVGTHSVVLTASGTPAGTAAQTHTYTINGGGGCTFDVAYLAGTTPPPTGNTWSFKVGSTTYSGTTQDAQMIDLFGIQSIIISGSATTGTGTILLSFINPAGAITTGNYSGTSTTSKMVQFQFTDGTVTYSGTPGASGSNVSGNIATLNTTTHIVQGTFSGTGKSGDPQTGTPVTITNGTFKARLP